MQESPLITSLQDVASSPSNLTTSKILSGLNLYPNLSLLPRWPGLEEDEEMAGGNEDAEQPAAGPSSPSPALVAQSEAGTSGFALKKDWTKEELETLGPRQLGRLKSQGVNIGDLLSRKRLKRVARENSERENGQEKVEEQEEVESTVDSKKDNSAGKKISRSQKKKQKRLNAIAREGGADEEDAMNQ